MSTDRQLLDITDETYGSYGDTCGRFYVCTECGVQVFDLKAHEAWHQRLDRLLNGETA